MKQIYNPLLEDFSVEYDKNGPNHKTITIKAGDIVSLEDWEADHIKKHLVNKLANDNPPANHNKEENRLKFEKLVQV